MDGFPHLDALATGAPDENRETDDLRDVVATETRYPPPGEHIGGDPVETRYPPPGEDIEGNPEETAYSRPVEAAKEDIRATEDRQGSSVVERRAATRSRPILRSVYQPRYSSLPRAYVGPGIGDFLRGCMRLWELCQEHGMDLEVHWAGHPLARWLESAEGQERIEADAVRFYHDNERFDAALATARSRGVADLATHAFPRRGAPSAACNDLLRSYLRPNEALREAYGRIVGTDWDAPDVPPYSVVHVRTGDGVLVKRSTLAGGRILGAEGAVRARRGTLGASAFVISDSVEMRDHLRDALGLRSVGAVPCHLGSLADPSDEAVRDTLIEFLLMSRARRILQLSVYRWGSGFSDACAALYDVPIERVSI